MAQLNTETLLEGITPAAPCGDDLSYDSAFMELERTSQAAPQDRIVGPEAGVNDGPDWRVVRLQAVSLFGRTKDLRVAVLLTKALLRTDGWNGLRDGTRIVRELLARYWDSLHPQLAEEDDFSPIMRGNALRDLADRSSMLNPVRALPLVSLAGLGSFSLRDIGLATGEIAAANGAPVPDLAKIDAAFENCPLEALQQTEGAVRAALENMAAIESYMAEKVGAFHTVSFDDLTAILRQSDRILTERLARRSAPAAASDGTNGVGIVATESEVGPISSADTSPVNSMPSPSVLQSAAFVAGQINSRAEVIRALEALCGYYERHEPSSPVPMLLRRAQRLVPMNFVDIMRDLAPAAMSDIEKIRGPEDPQN